MYYYYWLVAVIMSVEHSSQNPPCDFSSEAVDFTVDDVNCKNFHVVGELAGTDTSDNEL
jgi:hypothetical protein